MSKALTPGIRWTSNTKYVDIDTGEELTPEHLRSNKYIKVKTTKYGTLNHIETKGHIEYTIELRRNPQQKLFDSNE